MNLRTYLKGLGLGIFVTTLITSVSSGNAKATMTDAEIMARAEELGMVSENAMLLSQAQKLADDAAEKARASANEAKKSTSEDKAGKIDEKDASKTAPSVNTVSGAASRNSVSDPKTAAASVSAPRAGTKEDKTAGGSSDSSSGNSNSDSRKEKASASAEATKEAKASERASEEKQSEAAESKKKSAADDAGVVPGSGEIVTITISSGDSSVSVANKMVQAGLVNDARQFDSYLVLNGYDRKLVVGSHPIPKGASPEEMGSILTTKQ